LWQKSTPAQAGVLFLRLKVGQMQLFSEMEVIFVVGLSTR
jgi:hypothetical protein